MVARLTRDCHPERSEGCSLCSQRILDGVARAMRALPLHAASGVGASAPRLRLLKDDLLLAERAADPSSRRLRSAPRDDTYSLLHAADHDAGDVVALEDEKREQRRQ